MSRRRRGSAGHDGGGGGGGHGGGSGRWLVSYADFITLMFVVFTVLFSMARVDLSKFDQIAKSFRQAMGPAGPDIAPFQAEAQSGRPMGVMPPERPGVSKDYPPELIDPDNTRSLVRFNPTATTTGEKPPEPTPTKVTTPTKPTTTTPPTPPKPDKLGQLAEALKSGSSIAGIRMTDAGLEVSIAGRVLFDPQQTVLKPEAYAELNYIAAQITAAKIVQPVMVKCDADEKPSDPNSDPTTLAGVRAAAVTNYLRGRPGLNQLNFVSSAVTPPDGTTGLPSYSVTILVLRNAQ